MKFEIPEPCNEDWDAMEPRGSGRFCESCQHTVLDLAGKSRRQAEAMVGRSRGDYVCVQLEFDEAGDARFAPPPSRAPHFAGGLVLLAALSGCGSEPEDPIAEVEQMEPCSLGEPMQPSDERELATVFGPLPATGPVPAQTHGASLTAAEQAQLTAAKEAAREAALHPTPPASIRHPIRRGRMPIRRRGPRPTH